VRIDAATDGELGDNRGVVAPARVALRTVLCLMLGASLAAAQPASPAAAAPRVDPTTQPLLKADQITYLGSFTLPVLTGPSTAEADQLTYGGYGLGMGADGTSLYVGCHDWGDKLARVRIPEMGKEAEVVEPCTAIPNFAEISGPDGRVNGLVLGGSLWWNDRLIVSGYTFYDPAAGTRDGHNKTHFAGGPAIGDLKGPWRVGTDEPGIIAGNMAVVPEEWRASIGGPVVGGLCCISIIGRSSYGPAINVFNPDDIGRVPKIKSEMLAGYPDNHQNLGRYHGASEYFGGAMTMGGLAWPRGTRAVLAIVNWPSSFCYGAGTNDPALDGKPTGTGHVYCYDPFFANQGQHSKDWELSAIVFDAVDLARVKAGRRQPWNVKPVARLPLPNAPKIGLVQSATFDPDTGRLFVAPSFGQPGVIHVWQIR
jgi:hypothetical protein